MNVANAAGMSVLVFPLLALGAEPDAKVSDDLLTGFDAYVEKSMRDWDVPGLAVAIVKDDQVILARGYGVERLIEPEPVTSETLFPIGSCTKSFTATALALLVDEGRINWDDPVRKYLPDFALYDDFVSREVTIRDLLAHRVGLELGNKLWSSNQFSADEILERVRLLPPQNSFRFRFTYSNLMYLVAGRIVEVVSGEPWDQFVERRLLKPAGLRSTRCVTPQKERHSSPHAELRGAVQPNELEPDYAAAIAPAGAIWSNARDMAEWLRLNLSAGTTGENRLLKAETIGELHSPQIVIPVSNAGRVYPRKDFAAYGLGWFIEGDHGHKVVYHSGSCNGFIAWTTLLPDRHAGFVILANVHRTGINFAIHLRLLDTFLGRPPQDWSTIVRNDYRNGYQRKLREGREAYLQEHRDGAPPTIKPSHCVGTYESQLYGPIVIEPVENSSALQLRFGPRHLGRLEHLQNSLYLADFENPLLENWAVTFAASSAGPATAIHVVAAPWALPWYEDAEDLGTFMRIKAN